MTVEAGHEAWHTTAWESGPSSHTVLCSNVVLLVGPKDDVLPRAISPMACGTIGAARSPDEVVAVRVAVGSSAASTPYFGEDVVIHGHIVVDPVPVAVENLERAAVVAEVVGQRGGPGDGVPGELVVAAVDEEPEGPESSLHFRAVAVSHRTPGVLTFMTLLSASVLLV